MFNALRNLFKDSAALLFMLVLPLAYPLLYSFIYTNEVVREMPVCVVDLSGSPESRQFTRRVDATPDVFVAYHSRDMEEAQRLMRSQKVHGILYFPADFARKMQRMEQSPLEIYCDMGFILYYKTLYLTAFNVMLEYKHPLMQASGDIIKVHEVTMFNTTGGYGNFLLPAVLVLILQQTLLLGMCTEMGTRRQRGLREMTLPERVRQGVAYYALYLLLAGYVLVLVPCMFQFTQMVSWQNLLALLVPMLLSIVSFAVLVSHAFRHRETPLLFIPFTSVVFLFLTGVSWPECNIPWFWECFAWLFPSTPAVRAFVKMNCMGADLWMVAPYVWALLLQTLAYLALYALIYARRSAGKHADMGMDIAPIPS